MLNAVPNGIHNRGEYEETFKREKADVSGDPSGPEARRRCACDVRRIHYSRIACCEARQDSTVFHSTGF
jgi:hypothetical protein